MPKSKVVEGTMRAWRLIGELSPGGLRLFLSADENDKDQDLALADSSGINPDQCVDGVTWLDLGRPLVVTANGSGIGCTVPILNRHGDRLYSVTTPAGAAQLLRWVKTMRLEFEGKQASALIELASRAQLERVIPEEHA